MRALRAWPRGTRRRQSGAVSRHELLRADEPVSLQHWPPDDRAVSPYRRPGRLGCRDRQRAVRSDTQERNGAHDRHGPAWLQYWYKSGQHSRRWYRRTYAYAHRAALERRFQLHADRRRHQTYPRSARPDLREVAAAVRCLRYAMSDQGRKTKDERTNRH